jgi:putative ABC transport system substrate-binding protein
MRHGGPHILIRLLLLLLVAPLAAEAQQAGRIPRIGLLTNNPSPHLQAFETGLRELGYVEGKNIVVERRNANGESARLPALAAELVRLEVDVIVAPDPPSTLAAKSATGTIPIVTRSSADPVEGGLVKSLARPGGNITGVYSFSAELGPKRLELLRAALPHIARVAVLRNPTFPGDPERWKEVEQAARSLGLTLVSAEASSSEGLEGAFRTTLRQRADALITLRNPVIVAQKGRVVELAAKSRLPAIYDDREFVEAGGLMAYGANLDDLYRRTATYVGKILKGTRPADLPIERATKFELIINVKTARALALTIPPGFLMRADHLLE